MDTTQTFNPIDDINIIGFWSSLCTTILSIIYIVPQLVIGIEMPSSPTDLILILGPSFFLAPSFLIMMISVYYIAPVSKKIWSHIGIVFATGYFVFVTIVYFVGLTIQLPHTITGDMEQYELLKYEPKSFMTAIDALGYASMSIGMLFSSRVFAGTKLQLMIRHSFLATGILAPIILLTQIEPNIAYIGALWIISFPLSSSLLTMLFYQSIKTNLKVMNSSEKA
jgi:hypothetical protein